MKTSSIGTVLDIRIKMTVAAILCAFGIGLCIAFAMYPAFRIQLTYATAVIGGLAVVYSGYYTATTLQLNIKHEKMGVSFTTLREFRSINTIRLRLFLESELNQKNIPPSEFYAKVAENHDIHAAVRALLNLCEDASIKVQSGYADEWLLYKGLKYNILWSFNALHPFIIEMRDRGTSTLLMEHERLRDAWKENKSLATGAQLPDL